MTITYAAPRLELVPMCVGEGRIEMSPNREVVGVAIGGSEVGDVLRFRGDWRWRARVRGSEETQFTFPSRKQAAEWLAQAV